MKLGRTAKIKTIQQMFKLKGLSRTSSKANCLSHVYLLNLLKPPHFFQAARPTAAVGESHRGADAACDGLFEDLRSPPTGPSDGSRTAKPFKRLGPGVDSHQLDDGKSHRFMRSTVNV